MLDILMVLSVRSSYDKYRAVIPDHVLSDEAKQIADDMGVYFKTFKDVEVIDIDDFESWFCVLKNSNFKKEKLDVYREVFKNLRSHQVTPVTEEVVRSFIERDFSTKIADITLRICEGTDTDRLAEVTDLVQEYEKTAQIIKEEEDVIHGNIEELLSNSTMVTGGINWRLNALNKSLGPLRKGNFVIVAKRPETGGTTFAASEASFMAPQLGENEYVLWFNNEESGKDAVKPRIVSAALGISNKDMVADPAKSAADYLGLMGGSDKIIVFDPEYLSVGYINKRLKEYNGRVGLIVIDQLWKVHSNVGKNTSDVQRITMLFNQAREWAKGHAPVIAIHQADGSASNVKYIEMDQLHMSKTGVQGEADAIITLGKTNEIGFEKTRFINVPKNKLPGGPQSDPKYRHGKFEVMIEEELARFKD